MLIDFVSIFLAGSAVEVAFISVIGLLSMKLLSQNYKKIIIFIPIICALLCSEYIIIWLGQIISCLGHAFDQYQTVSQFSPAYADYMKYLYIDPLLQALKYIPRLLIGCAPIIITTYYYKKLEHNTIKEKEIKKMKIQDL